MSRPAVGTYPLALTKALSAEGLCSSLFTTKTPKLHELPVHYVKKGNT